MKDQFMILKDGRKLVYIEYGKPDGIPLMIFHGTPGSRIWFFEDDKIAKSLGIRLIATDRPGYGISDEKPGRSIIDWASDIEELANYLGIDVFSVLGVSGGGPYSAACAHQMPNRVVSASMISSGPPFENGKPPKGMCRVNRISFSLSKYVPWLMRWSFKAQKKMMENNPAKIKAEMKKGTKHLCEYDKKMIEKHDIELAFLHLKEATRVSFDGAVNEPALLMKPWGFSLEELNVPVFVWHGEDDTLAPAGEMKKVAGQIPKCTTHFIPHGGHFISDDEQIWEEILVEVKETYLDFKSSKVG